MKTTFYVGLVDRDGAAVNNREVISEIARDFKAFTAWHGVGYWEGVPEDCLIVEIIHETGPHGRAAANDAELTARRLAVLFNQTAVLVYQTAGDSRLVFNPKIGQTAIADRADGLAQQVESEGRLLEAQAKALDAVFSALEGGRK